MMSERNVNREPDLTVNQTFRELQQNGNFDISPCDNIINIDDNPKFKKLELTSSQKIQMSALASQLPAVMAANSMSAAAAIPDLYTMSFPKGLPCTLVKLKDGTGYTNTLRGLDGKFMGNAPLNKFDISKQLATQAAVLGTFSAMSVVSGQYFLAQINSELDRIKLGMDKILEFLYGDKKAELMAEVNFAKYAFQNYSAIMANESQKIATITSLQKARQIAMKDCEFYISDLESTVRKSSDIISTVNKAIQIKESLDFALQLCVMSSVMEVYYSQNFDDNYLKYIENDISLYIDKCEKNILANFNQLLVLVQNAKSGILKKVDKDKLERGVSRVLEQVSISGESELKKSLRSGLYLSTNHSTYYLSKDGDVYIKNE